MAGALIEAMPGGRLARAMAIVWGLLLTIGLAGCELGVSESVAADVPLAGWTDPVEMRYDNTDTLSVRELQFSLRHSAAATRSEGLYALWAVSPRGAITVDTLRVAIEPNTQSGNRLSEAMAAPLPAPMAERGEYRFTVTPLQNTRDVWSVAITLNRKSPYGQR